MDKLNMIKRLRNAGMYFAQGMTAAQLDRAEAVFGFRFPREIRAFLSFAVPVGKGFFDYRDVSEENQKKFREFQNWMEDRFRFDLEKNREDMLELLAEPLGNPGDFDSAVMNYFHSSVKLIPFYIHRCFFDGMDDMPIVSFMQSVDSIFYASNFQDYLEVEFLHKDHDAEDPPQERKQETGIWNYLVTP